jgi:tetratricopeptide (TPR) repeat protein
MFKLLHYKLAIFMLLVPIAIQAQINDADNFRWDQKMIKEATIWKKLLSKHNESDQVSNWAERKEALTAIIEKYPDSEWADDACLLLEGERAIIEHDIEGSIKQLHKIIDTYPNGNSIVTSWNSSSGCRINETWLMFTGGLVFLNDDSSVRISFPFNRDGIISKMEEEMLIYCEHVEKYPQPTKNVARYIISSMLLEKGDIAGAIIELEDIIAEYPDLSLIRNADYELSQREGGSLIECEPPLYMMPIWRVQYAACTLLIDLYQKQGDKKKADNLMLRLIAECSPDGWYWNINRHLGDIYAKSGNSQKAFEQYDISKRGIHKIAQNQSKRMKLLYDNGHVVMPDGFTNWEDEILKSYSPILKRIKQSQNKLTDLK